MTKFKTMHLLYEIEVVTDANSCLSDDAIWLVLSNAIKKYDSPLIKEFTIFQKGELKEKEAKP
jgi:hypothetical protein